MHSLAVCVHEDGSSVIAGQCVSPYAPSKTRSFDLDLAFRSGAKLRHSIRVGSGAILVLDDVVAGPNDPIHGAGTTDQPLQSSGRPGSRAIDSSASSPTTGSDRASDARTLLHASDIIRNDAVSMLDVACDDFLKETGVDLRANARGAIPRESTAAPLPKTGTDTSGYDLLRAAESEALDSSVMSGELRERCIRTLRSVDALGAWLRDHPQMATIFQSALPIACPSECLRQSELSASHSPPGEQTMIDPRTNRPIISPADSLPMSDGSGELRPNDPDQVAGATDPTTSQDPLTRSPASDGSAVAGPFVLYDVKQLIEEVAILRQAVCILIQVAWNHDQSLDVISKQSPMDVNNPRYGGIVRIHPTIAVAIGMDPSRITDSIRQLFDWQPATHK